MKADSEGAVKIDIDGLDSIRHPPPKATFRRGNFNIPDAYKILERHLPSKDDFEAVLKEFSELQGVWQYYRPSVDKFTLCSPTVNNEGDLLFELRRAPEPTPKFTSPVTGSDWLKSLFKVPVSNGVANGSPVDPTGLGIGANGSAAHAISPATGPNGSSAPPTSLKSSVTGANASLPTPTTPTSAPSQSMVPVAGSKPLGTSAALKGATPASTGLPTNGANGAATNGNG